MRHREGRFAHRTELWVCDMDGAQCRQLTSELATVMQPVWSPDGRRVAFSGARAEGDAQSGLYVIDVESGKLIRLAAASLEIAALEDAVRWAEGWIIRAPSSPQPQPLLNDVHGRPAAFALLDFDTNVFCQVLCSQGWAVLALNPVGSASYGSDFCSRLAGRWRHLDLPAPRGDTPIAGEWETDDRITISGKSYGGYLSAWAVGHTETFRAAVVMAPVGNIETHFGTSDGGYYADPQYLNTAPDFDRERARDMSPLQHISKTRTPTLFLQGKDDERCPKCQSEEMFVSLCRAGVTPTELVLYPGETHLFLSEGGPDCRADAAQRIVDWLVAHVEGKTS